MKGTNEGLKCRECGANFQFDKKNSEPKNQLAISISKSYY